MLISLLIIEGILIGYAIFLYWLSDEQDITTGDIVFGFVASLCGPLTTITMIMENSKIVNKVWIKKRGK